MKYIFLIMVLLIGCTDFVGVSPKEFELAKGKCSKNEGVKSIFFSKLGPTNDYAEAAFVELQCNNGANFEYSAIKGLK